MVVEHVAAKEAIPELARRLFAEASATYPASVTAQGTMIARLCKEQMLDPLELLRELLGDEQSITILKNAADHAHKSHGRNIHPVQTGELKKIIMSNFMFAKSFISLPNAALVEIEHSYPEFFAKRDRPSRQGDMDYHFFAQDIYHKHATTSNSTT